MYHELLTVDYVIEKLSSTTFIQIGPSTWPTYRVMAFARRNDDYFSTTHQNNECRSSTKAHFLSPDPQQPSECIFLLRRNFATLIQLNRGRGMKRNRPRDKFHHTAPTCFQPPPSARMSSAVHGVRKANAALIRSPHGRRHSL